MATHWGWYWKIKKKHIPKKRCSNLIAIDSFRLLKANNQGFTVKPLGIQASIHNDQLFISYGKQVKHPYLINITRQPCNYGGFRAYFHCPLCQKRMRFLYFAENSVFLCRKCLNLGYPSQRLRPTDRYLYMSSKIEKQRPRYMHRQTFEKLQRKQRSYDIKYEQALNEELRLWYGEKAELFIDDFFVYGG